MIGNLEPSDSYWTYATGTVRQVERKQVTLQSGQHI